MTIIAPRTALQSQNTIANTYRSVDSSLKGDNSIAGIAVKQAIFSYLSLPAAKPADLVTLREALYTYQAQLVRQVGSYKAAEILLLSIKSILTGNQVGDGQLDNGLAIAHTHIPGPSYADILVDIRSVVAHLGGFFTIYDIAVAIAGAIDASDDSMLISALTLDLITAPQSIMAMQGTIASLSGDDGPSMSFALYNVLFNGINGWYVKGDFYPSMTLGMVSLGSDIILYQNENSLTYVDTLISIKAAVAALTDEFTPQDIIAAIAGAINANSDSILIDSLQLDVASSTLSASMMQANIASISGADGPAISVSIYNALGNANTSSWQGALALTKRMVINHVRDLVSYADIITNISEAVNALTGDFSKKYIAIAVAGAINASDDLALINAIELDLAQVAFRYPTSWIRDKIATIAGADAQLIAANFYQVLERPNTSMRQGAITLSSDITLYYNKYSVAYADIVTNIKAAVADLTGDFSKNDIATAIITAINASDDLVLVNALELDLASASNGDRLLTPLEIQASIASVFGTDGPSISASLYAAFADAYESALRGALFLSKAIAAYHEGRDEYVTTLTGAIGEVPIGPEVVTYLNKCTYAEGVYKVGGSVFTRFDPDSMGPLLSSMSGLNSVSGHLAGLAQCGSWANNNVGLYATTTYPGGTAGDAIATGCKALLTNGDVMSLCHSVFDVA